MTKSPLKEKKRRINSMRFTLSVESNYHRVKFIHSKGITYHRISVKGFLFSFSFPASLLNVDITSIIKIDFLRRVIILSYTVQYI